ncbi:MAG: hypothetical protein QOH95_1425, partial [Gaiellaceae bacterium]|nr:hypothetical protein [Gaiellaceae bacterium]
MTELTQPLAAAPSERTTKASELAAPRRAATFSEVVYTHFDWWRAYREDRVDTPTVAGYQDALARFEDRHGEIVGAYWCTHDESAVAMTQKIRRGPWARPVSTVHRESDWATQNTPDIARELHRC